MSNISIHNGDSITKLKEIPSSSVDLIIADPPYNLGKDYGNGSDKKCFDSYLEFSKKWLTEADRVLKDNGSIYIFMGFRFISYLYNILDRDMGYHFGSWICWHYTQGIGKTKGFSPRHDDILMFNKSSKATFNLDSIRIPQKYYRARNNMRGANPGDVWKFSHIHYCNENRFSHPTQKPEGIIERMILASSNKGDTVLDPFLGSGTTLRVCQQLDRKGIGIELNPDYVKMATERLKKPFTGFDSIDPRMCRVPLDLRKKEIRIEYLKNHHKWFLQNHGNSLDLFKEAIIKTYGEETYQIEFNLFKLIKASWQKKSSIHQNFNKHLTTKGEIGYSNQGDDNINKITKEQREAILAPDENLERPEASQDPIRTNLTIKIVDFYGDQKWTFMYAGKTLKPHEVEYSEQIKEKLKEMRKDVKYNSKLPVEMIITYEEDDNGEAISGTERYQILQVTGDLIQQPQNTSFNFNKMKNVYEVYEDFVR